MPDIPEEAVQAADDAWINSEGLFGRGQMDHALAAAYPIIAAQVRREVADQFRAKAARIRSIPDDGLNMGQIWHRHELATDYEQKADEIDPRQTGEAPDPLAVLDDTGDYPRKDEPMQVITTTASDCYHASEDCPAWKAGRQGSEAHGYTLHEIRRLTVADAEAAKKKPCPTCVTP
ncbi:hypothetical protein [Nonomuraea indica]|uniref:hypothetical protein n=1 Tax=Nonomuraea indica TaxID=1581193 RepID=UPI000C7D140C|nr:hypothetical protein [Nonomuraea indica]